MSDREHILAALSAFAHQRPGMDPRNYISGWDDREGRRAYRSESRAITKDLHDFRALLAAVAWRESITANKLREGFRAFSGRLKLEEKNGETRLEYCTGQYFPTEYRKAACAVLGAVLFDHFRACVVVDPGGPNKGDIIRQYARRELGANLQRRWVD